MPAAASAGSGARKQRQGAAGNQRHVEGREPSRNRCGRDAPYQACQDTLALNPPLERQICPAERAEPRNEGRRQTVNASLLSPDGGTGFTDSGKGNLSRRPPARRSSSTRTLEIVL